VGGKEREGGYVFFGEWGYVVYRVGPDRAVSILRRGTLQGLYYHIYSSSPVLSVSTTSNPIFSIIKYIP